MASMSILQRILSHSVSIILIIIIALVYIYRDDLFPSDDEAVTSEQVSETASSTTAGTETSSQPATETAAEPVETDMPAAEADAGPSTETTESSASTAAAPTESAAAAPVQAQQPPMPMQPPMYGYRDPRMQPPPGYGRPPQTPMTAPAPAQAPAAESAEPEPVMQARQAYWNRNFDKAIEQYQALAEAEPENPDPHGELGNLYYSQGRWQDAAKSYYEAATRLLQKGHTGRAMYMQQIIAGLDRATADKLAKQIAEARQPAPVEQ